MNIGIVGLGLIGGSLAKAIKKYSENKVFGYDLSSQVLQKAQKEGSVDSELFPENMGKCHIILLAIYPQATVKYVKDNKNYFSPNTILIDCCGVKKYICDEIQPIAAKNNFNFIGGHPMAGLEVAGYENSCAELYNNASMILTPKKDEKEEIIKTAAEFFLSLGFNHIEITTPENHDKNIAYTSQLAHVVSNAYIKSPGAAVHQGFSAGSYKDLTRVAKLEENMWTELFMENRDNLLNEINLLTKHLKEYATALENQDEKYLKELLKTGRKLKEEVD
ncbi:MAG: prephenate dehydrogenase [Clostridiales bacterium]